ncbi:bridge-like lipid transfer protein family member 3B isoform X1 [Anopheles coustani]|uniref:bridge-like lipid transfer protein family member 3B isoform X1 n=1 Tax=Anopheles coustani TaxID=139045 RepID=UPI002657E114|nr:bridge-like lipid transfer protein family member 3B isoform X1 [Anopheles coustani]
MVSIIKNQLLKHLSRYTKNLSPDKVNLSAFRGEGELSNLQLDENVLTELLELPAWLRLTSAWCNHVSFRISWTKLKSTPIMLTLDEVNITIETCEIARSGTPTARLSSLTAPQGKYSFIHKVIDGITIVVNTVNVNLKSPAFTASVQMSRIRVESRTPKWLLGDLRVTRLKDPTRGMILIFKELSWQTVRIEASSTQDLSLTPLRLLTNQARCRITIKKRLSDCSIVASRLVLILDDLLWVLTDSQLKAALHFVDSLTGLIKASTNVVQRVKAQKKLETLPEYQAQLDQSKKAPDTQQLTAAQRYFNVYDVRETSYHFFSQRIDLHLCDDVGVGRSSHPSLTDGGALQISVQGFQIDYYPYHLAKADRSHWPKYREASIPPALWLEQSLNAFRETILNLSQPNRPPQHASLERTTNFGQQQQQQQQQQQAPPASPSFGQQRRTSIGSNSNQQQQQQPSVPGTPGSVGSAAVSPMKKHVLDNLAKLMCACVVMKIEEFTLYRVTTSGNKQMPKEFVAADRDRVPPDMATLHAEFTYFYYPGDFVFPLPPSKAFVHINPVQVHFHLDSFLWLSSFVLNLHESLLRTNNVTSGLNSPSTPSTSSGGGGGEQQPNIMYMDVKVECIMPRLIFEASPGAPQQRDRPKAMHVEVSRFALTNIRETGASRADLAQAISSLQEGSLVFGSGFPSKPGDLCIVTDRILSHIAATDVVGGSAYTAGAIPNGGGVQSAFSNLTRYATWREPRDVWCLKLDPVWVEFYGARSIGPSRAIPFVDAVPVTIWLHGRSDELPPELLEPPECGDGSKRLNSNNFNSNKSSESSLILSVNSLKQSLDLSETPLGSHWSGGPPLGPLDDEKWKRLSVASAPAIPEEGSPVKLGPATTTTTSHKLPPQLPSVEDSDADNRTADLHIIAHVSNLVSVQIDHYQYLFLLRLAEELTEMATFLSLDSKRILQAANTEKSIIVGCVIPQVEVSLVMPSQTPGKESSGGDGESVLPDSASLGSGWPNSMDQTRNSNIFSSTECPSPIATEPPLEVHHISNPNTHGHNVQIQSVPTTSSTSGVASVETPSSSSVVVVTARTVGSTNTAGTAIPGGQQQSQHQQQHAALQTQTKTRTSTTTNTTDSTSFSKELNSGLSSMKKGFSHLMTSIDSALKTNTSDDMSDTLSVQSDISSDSELQRVLEDTEKTTDCMDAMFRLYPFGQESTIKMAPIEVASEVCEDPFLTNMSSPSDPSESSSLKRRDLVSMVTFRLTTVEVIRQNVGSCSSLRLQMSAISCDECGAIPWDEFQGAHRKPKTKFGTRCRAWNIAPHNPEAPPCVAIRLEEELTLPADSFKVTDKSTIMSWFKRKLNVEVKDLDLQLSMSTVVGLGDLAEDEVIPTPIPMEVTVENVKVNLIEDRPPVNITSPGTLPVNLAIGRVLLTRDEAGVFHVQPTYGGKPDDVTDSVGGGKRKLNRADFEQRRERDREVKSLHLVLQQLKQDNEGLKRQLTDNEKTSESNRMKVRQENDVLRTYLKAAQDDITTLLDEKRTLMATIKSLQDQLTAMSDVQLGQQDGKR